MSAAPSTTSSRSTNISLHVRAAPCWASSAREARAKTTAIRINLRCHTAQISGTVLVLGEDPPPLPGAARAASGSGYMPQLFVLYPDLTVRENVGFMAATFGIPPWRRRAPGSRSAHAWSTCGRRANRRGVRSSAAMQRRLELALRPRPPAVAADSSTSQTAGIDPLLRTRHLAGESSACAARELTILVTNAVTSARPRAPFFTLRLLWPRSFFLEAAPFFV